MRVVSQDGMIDVPYDMSVVNVDYRNKKEIVATIAGCGEIENLCRMAKYSTEAKAIKAMEMLREMYCRAKTFHSVCAGCFDSLGEGLNSGNKELPILFDNLLSMNVFKFPKDEEIEVEDE